MVRVEVPRIAVQVKRLVMAHKKKLAKHGLLESLVRASKREVREWGRVSRCQTALNFLWGGLGKLGRLIQLLYCGRLFASAQDRQLYLRLDPTNGVTEKDLCRIASLASLVLQGSQLDQDQELRSIEILDRVMDSGHFRHEKLSRCSWTVRCIMRLYRTRKDPALVSLLRDVLHEYKLRKGIHPWRRIGPSWLPSLPSEHERDTCIDDEQTLSQLIQAINRCSLTNLLLTARPPDSITPHGHALMICMHHAYLWMIASPLPIFRHLPELSYSTLRSSSPQAERDLIAAAQDMCMMERVPCDFEVCKRHELTWHKLYTAPGPATRHENYDDIDRRRAPKTGEYLYYPV